MFTNGSGVGKVYKRILAIVCIMAVSFTLCSCDRPKSPVGESKRAVNIRELFSGFGKKSGESGTGGSDHSLSAGVNSANRSAVADEETSNDTIVDGDPDGTKLTLWTYTGAHVSYYRKMLKKWNDEDPDYTLEITFKIMPYEDLHAVLSSALDSGGEIPDICDVDAYRFAEISDRAPEWFYPLDVASAPYIYDMHPARMDAYKLDDGKRYAVPFRMGACVQYWNMELLELAGITQKEVDAVKTWEDYKAIGEKFKKAPGMSGKYFTAVNPDDAVWPMLALAEYSEDTENVGSAVSKMTETYKAWIDEGLAKESEDITADVKARHMASFTGSLAFMDTFVQDLHDEYGKWYITKCPVFADGQPCSVCLDDTPTVITAGSPSAALAADFICYAKMYNDNAKSVLWPDLSYDVCNKTLWEDDSFAHDVTNEYDTFFRNYPYDVLKEIEDRIASVKP